MLSWRSALVTCFVLLAFGCGGGPTTEPTPPVSELPRIGDEGGTIDGPRGIALDVPAGVTGGAEYDVELSADDAPPDDVLDEGERFVGPMFSISASEAFEVPPDDPIIMRVPLPEGPTASSATHWIAVRAPREAYMGDVEPFWHVMPVEVDETGAAVKLPLFGMPAEALEVALVTSPGTDVAVTSSTAEVQPLRSWSDDVDVVLRNARLFGDAAEQQRVRDVVRGFALEAIEGFRDLGFDAPLWQRRVWSRDYVLNVQHETKGICTNDVLGTYTTLINVIYVCYYGDHEDTTRYTVYHEVFHAVQNAYLDLSGDRGKRGLWFLEGTAALSERSLATGEPIRSPDRYPDIGQGFGKSDADEYINPYALQDFWAFVLRSAGLDFADLIAVMESGREVSRASAHRVLRETEAYADRFRTFDDAYWAYARNQAWERTQDLGDAGQSPSKDEDAIIIDERPPCSPIDPDGVWPFPVTYSIEDEAFFNGESSFTFKLAPYMFYALQLEVPDGASATNLTRLTVTLKSDGVRIDNRNAARGTMYFGPSCSGAERSAITVHPWSLEETPLVLLLANVDEANTKSFEISVEVSELDAPNATGVWEGTYRSDAYLDFGVFGLMCAEVVQTDEALTGTFFQRFPDGDDAFPVEGTVLTNNVTFGSLGADAIEFSGWLTWDSTYMAGSYTTESMGDVGEWAVVKTDASSCDAATAPAYDFNSAVGTYHNGLTGEVGTAYVSVWDFEPFRPVYPLSITFSGPEEWNGGRPLEVSHVPSGGAGGPWWLWGRRAWLMPADGTFHAEPGIHFYSSGTRRSTVVDASQILPVPTGLRARLDAPGDTVEIAWDDVPGAVSYQPNLVRYRNGVYDVRRYFVTEETSHTLAVPSSTGEDEYTFALFVFAFSEHFGDYTVTGRQFNASRSVTIPVEGAEPPVDVTTATSDVDPVLFDSSDASDQGVE